MANVDINIKVQSAAAKRQLDQLSRSSKQLSVNVKQTTSAFKTFAGTFAAIGAAAAVRGIARLTGSIVSFGQQSINVAGQIETITTQFEVLTGSAALADKAVRDLQEFAASTPFQFKDLAKAEQRLLSFGFSLENSQDLLKDLGDVSAASGTDIAELSLIFGQVSAAGKLTGERLLQLQERAIPIGPALAKSLGVTEDAVRDLVSQGKVDFATFEEAFKSLNDTGEFAFDGLAKRSATLEGRISTLKDNFELLQADVGQGLLPAFKAITTAFTALIQQIRESGALDDLINSLAKALPQAISFAFNAVKFFVDLFFNARQAFNTFNAAVDIILGNFVSLGIGALQAAKAVKSFFGADTSGLDTQIDGLRNLRDAFEEQAIETIRENQELEESQTKLANLITDSKNFVIDAYNKEKAAIEETAEADTASTQKRVANVQQLTQAQIQENKRRADEQKKLNEQLAALREENAILEEAERISKQEVNAAFFESNIADLQEFFTATEQARFAASLQETEGETQKNILIEQLRKQSFDRRIKQREEFDKKEKQLQDLKRKTLVDGSANLFGALAGAASLGGKKLFNISKAFSIAEATIKGVQAVQSALASPPGPPFTVPLAAAIGIRTATNVAQISQTQPPAFQDGGIVPGGSFSGDRVLARVNSGEMILNREQQNNLFNMVKNGTSGSQPIQVTSVVEIDGEAIARAVSVQEANGFQTGEVV